MQDSLSKMRYARIVSTVCMSALAVMVILTRALRAEEADNVFNEYERCIKQRVHFLHMNMDRPVPEALVVEVGETIHLTCSPCIRPDVNLADMGVTWYRARHELRASEPVPMGTANYELADDLSLVIKGAGDIHAAQYFCIHNGLVESSYFVEVVQHERKRLVFQQGNGNKPAKDLIYTDMNIRLYTVWQEWSECSRCDKVGLRKRTGICTVQKINITQSSKPVDIRALNVFMKGLPCQSSSARQLQNDMPVLRGRRSEILVDYCYRACPTMATVRNITDRYGYLIEHVEGPSMYSLKEQRPALPPMVHRETHYLPLKASINFTCPRKKLRARQGPSVIRWENGTTVIHPMYLRTKTRGRVYIDNQNRLVFRAVWPRDTAYYSCWQGGWLVAVFRVVCSKTDMMNEQIPDMMFYLGGLIAVLTVACIGCQMWKASRDKRYQ